MRKYLHKLKLRIENLYLLYELNTYIAICEPWEKKFINCLFLTVLTTVLYACYAYLPGYVRTLLYFVTPVGFIEQSAGESGGESSFVVADHGKDFIRNAQLNEL